MRIRFGLFPEGALRAEPTIVGKSLIGCIDFRAVADSAQREVQEDAPIEELPEASCEQCRDIELAFSPGDFPGQLPLGLEPALLDANGISRQHMFV